MYTASITVDRVIDALATFVEFFVNGAEIVRGQANRAPPPHSPAVVLTEILQKDLSFAVVDYLPDDDQAEITGSTQIDIQIDFYGDQASDFCRAIKSVFVSHYAYQFFPENIRPLYTSDGVQSPMVTGEQQWGGRWTLTASLQYNAKVIVPQEFADDATPSVILADN